MSTFEGIIRAEVEAGDPITLYVHPLYTNNNLIADWIRIEAIGDDGVIIFIDIQNFAQDRIDGIQYKPM